MPVYDSPLRGEPVWIELFSSDPGRAIHFYSELFGWTDAPESSQRAGYVNFLLRGRPVAGLMRNDPASAMIDEWTVYLDVPDAGATCARANRYGGSVLTSEPVANLGVMLLLRDPSGSLVGGWEAQERGGFEVFREAGAPSWLELHTRSYAAAVRFYENVFGWRTSEIGRTDEDRYSVLGTWEEPRAGIQDAAATLPDNAPSRWMVYFGVSDVDRAADRVEELGGSVIEPPSDSDFGRVTTVTDPTGAVLRLMRGNR
ncbi:VOC family protein [Klugiella xanthotipulae]|uniref:VOC domain-containing protein n=1 Tax=Klugiella xanthotipulae TaxID=244735 RepID=A0A543HTH0_9MICO|nr:VOC family protein [Klugiella xanthotipulae]TQM61549.1 hypothetical protein FB466_2506 [Klugiella xanthotipulae]